MIKTLSPYYLYIPFVDPITEDTCTSYTLKLYVWDGLKDSPPVTESYSMTKNNPTSSTASDKVNIARLLNDFIDFNVTYGTETSIINAYNQRWCKVTLTYTTISLDEFVTGDEQDVSTELVLKGYGGGMEGENTTTPGNRILMQGTEFKVNRNGVFNMPFMVLETPPEPFIIEITSYEYTSSGHTSSTIDINFTIDTFTPTDVIVQKSINGVDWSFLYTLPNVSPLTGVVITYPVLGTTWVRLAFFDGLTLYHSNEINISQQ